LPAGVAFPEEATERIDNAGLSAAAWSDQEDQLLPPDLERGVLDQRNVRRSPDRQRRDRQRLGYAHAALPDPVGFNRFAAFGASRSRRARSSGVTNRMSGVCWPRSTALNTWPASGLRVAVDPRPPRSRGRAAPSATAASVKGRISSRRRGSHSI